MMKRVLIAGVAAFGVLAAVPAVAQTSTTVTTTTGPAATGSITIAPEKRTVSSSASPALP
jgi:maltose-binding protein MalE